MLKIKDLKKTYEGQIQALKGITLDIPQACLACWVRMAQARQR